MEIALLDEVTDQAMAEIDGRYGVRDGFQAAPSIAARPPYAPYFRHPPMPMKGQQIGSTCRALAGRIM